uniref:Uncharacterized protein n=1 Tax=Anguilla anguilla TaxID=7936 RepID=A0A0E9X062_ANGAN
MNWSAVPKRGKKTTGPMILTLMLTSVADHNIKLEPQFLEPVHYLKMKYLEKTLQMSFLKHIYIHGCV